MTKLAIVGLWLAACASPTHEPEQDVENGTLIRASVGGTVVSGEVTLVIPPGSLSGDTVIGIEPDIGAPSAEADGFAVFGQGYRFSPPGTQFSLAKPAVLTMPYDQAAIAAQSLDGRTVALAYFDEELGRYFTIGGELDVATGFVTARVEHFTLYVATAATLLPGNNAPTIALQSPVPSLLRADSPIYLRATIRDYDLGGSVAGAELHYRTAATAPDFAVLRMKPEATLDTFAALIPAAHAVAGPSTIDVEYFVTAVDNLGASRTSATTTADFTRTFAPGSLVMGPATPAIAAGFERTFTFQGRDETNTLYAMVPETASAPGIGETTIGTAGVTFRARTVGTAIVTAGFGAHDVSQMVTVFNGALEKIAMLDRFGLELSDTVVIKDDQRFQLDALGYDAYGNSILVNPVWSSEVGHVSSGGLFDSLGGQGSGRVTATVGGVVGTQWFTINQRQWQTDNVFGTGTEFTAYQRLASFAGKPYAAFLKDNVFEVMHEEAGTWVSDGSPTTAQVFALAIAGGVTRVHAAWIEGPSVRVAHRELGGWVADGGALEIDPGNPGLGGLSNDWLDFTADGDTLYTAWTERASDGGYNIYVKRWNGTSWVLLGGQVQPAGMGAVYPSIEVLNGAPYVAFRSMESTPQIYVRRWTGTVWESVGGTLNLYPQYTADSPKLTIAGGALVAAYLQGIPFTTPPSTPVYIVAFQNNAWTQIDPGGVFSPPSFAHLGGWSVSGNGEALYVGHVEYGTGGARRVAARRNMRTGDWTHTYWGTSSFGTFPRLRSSTGRHTSRRANTSTECTTA